MDSCDADFRFGHKFSAIPSEVSIPIVSSGMKQSSNDIFLRPDSADTRAFVAVAIVTRPSEVFAQGWTIVLLRNNVIRLEW